MNGHAIDDQGAQSPIRLRKAMPGRVLVPVQQEASTSRGTAAGAAESRSVLSRTVPMDGPAGVCDQ